MNHEEKVKAIQHIRPNSEFVLNGLELKWLDSKQTEPTNAEIEAGWVAYQAKIETEKQEAAAKKAALLNRLGITEAEAKLLLS